MNNLTILCFTCKYHSSKDVYNQQWGNTFMVHECSKDVNLFRNNVTKCAMYNEDKIGSGNKIDMEG